MDKEYFLIDNPSLEKAQDAEKLLLFELEKILADIETRCRQLINHKTSSGDAIIKDIISRTLRWQQDIKESIAKAKKEAIKEILFWENERRLGGED